MLASVVILELTMVIGLPVRLGPGSQLAQQRGPAGRCLSAVSHWFGHLRGSRQGRNHPPLGMGGHQAEEHTGTNRASQDALRSSCVKTPVW